MNINSKINFEIFSMTTVKIYELIFYYRALVDVLVIITIERTEKQTKPVNSLLIVPKCPIPLVNAKFFDKGIKAVTMIFSKTAQKM